MGDGSSQKIKVLVVDDHPIVRAGISAIVQTSVDMMVIAQAATGEEAVQIFASHLPDVTLMDLRLPGLSGVDAIRTIRHKHPEARFVVLTTYEGDEDIFQALAAGAKGYIIKGMPHTILLGALRSVCNGGQYLPREVSHTLSMRTPNSELSAREREVLSLIAAGNSNRDIASALGITEGTVKCHVSVILMRLGVPDRTKAVLVALQRGLVHL